MSLFLIKSPPLREPPKVRGSTCFSNCRMYIKLFAFFCQTTNFVNTSSFSFEIVIFYNFVYFTTVIIRDIIIYEKE